jgi:hypothetical protein
MNATFVHGRVEKMPAVVLLVDSSLRSVMVVITLLAIAGITSVGTAALLGRMRLKMDASPINANVAKTLIQLIRAIDAKDHWQTTALFNFYD